MIVFCDGFDHYQAPLMKWDSKNTAGNYSGAVQILPTSGRNGSGAIDFPARGGGGFGGSGSGGNLIQKNFGNQTTMFCGFALWVDLSSTVQDTLVLAWQDGGTSQVSLFVTNSGVLYFYNGSTILGSSPFSITSRSWNFVEVLVTINTSTGICTLNVNGVNWLSLTGKNTAPSGVAQMSSIRIGSYCLNGLSAHSMFDDFYLANTSAPLGSFLGDVGVRGLMPTGDGTTQNFLMNASTWAATTIMGIARRILDSNNNIQQISAVTSDAKTGGSPPTWNVSLGGTTTDNHVTWTNLGSPTHFLEVNQNPPAGVAWRRGNIAYTVGQLAWDDNNNLIICTTAGTTNANDGPTWNNTLGGTTSDSSVVWTNVGLGEDTYISSSTIGDIDRYTFPSLTGSAVKAVCMTMRARKDDVSTRSIRGATKSGVVLGDSGADLVVLSNYQYLQGFLTTDPNTGVAWTMTGVNSAEFGVKVTA